MESQLQNPEFRINPENFHPCTVIKTGLDVIKLFHAQQQLSMKFILLINVKMATSVGILTFISRINTISDSFKARNIVNSQHFSFYEQLKLHHAHAQLSCA